MNTEKDILKRIAIAKLKPDSVADLTPKELADLVLVVLGYVKQVNQAIQEGKIKGDKGQDAKDLVPDVDYLSLSTATREINRVLDEVVNKSNNKLDAALSKIKNGVNGKDGKDAVVTKEQIEQAAKIASELVKLPDFATLITQEPEAIRNSLELLQGDERLDISAIKGWEDVVKDLKSRPSGEMMVGGIRFLSQLVDVRTNNLQNNDVLKWNSTTLQWENGTGGGGSGDVATDAIWDAKGDLVVGTGADTASRLAVGANGTVLTADSAEATGVKWAAIAGTGDVTAASAFGTDNVLIKSDGTGKGVQATGISIADTTNNMSGVGTLNTHTIPGGTGTLALTSQLHDAVTVTDSSEIDFTLTGQDITASLFAGSIDETKLDASVNASLDLADSALQSGDNISELTNNSGFISDITGENIADLADVVVTTVADNEVLAYDNASGNWINQTAAEAGLAAATHTHTASDVTDFDTEVSNNADVAANTAARHSAVTVSDSAEIDFTLTGQQISASLVAGSIDETKLDASVNASLDLADSAVQDLSDLGVTATAAELNALDGITATVTELNYTDGVTSNIQTQIDAKPTISSGAGAPASTPTKVGDIYIDTTGDDAYIAVGTASSSDWEKSNDGAGGGISDGDKGDITVSGSGTTWTIDNDTIGLDELSATGTPSASTFLRGDNTWATPAGSGDVSKVGTPVDGQIGVWTGDGTIEGDTALTFDTSTDKLSTVALNLSGLTASEIVITDASKNLVSAAVATYPSLTELAYVKGVTSAIQTQLNAKAASSHTHTKADLTDVADFLLESEVDADIKTLSLPASTTISAFGATLTDDTDAATARTTLGLVIGTHVQAYDADLTTWAGLTPSANAQSLVTAANYAAMRTLLDLEAGTDFYSIAATDSAIDTDIATHAALTATHGVSGAIVGTTDTQTLSAKTLTSPVINTGVSGTAILDEDDMVSNSATQLATQQSIKAYVDAEIAGVSAGSGITWSEVTGTTQAATVNNAYVANNASQVVVTLPTTAAVGSIVRVAGKGAGGWRIAQNASEVIYFGTSTTTTGTGGYIESSNRRDAVELVCVTADTEWSVISSIGNITIV